MCLQKRRDSDADTMDTGTTGTSTQRPKDETSEQRRERKRLVKAQRKERREEKRANTSAFDAERHRQAVQRATNPQTNKAVVQVL